jgi:hypothetical protein
MMLSLTPLKNSLRSLKEINNIQAVDRPSRGGPEMEELVEKCGHHGFLSNTQPELHNSCLIPGLSCTELLFFPPKRIHEPGYGGTYV